MLRARSFLIDGEAVACVLPVDVVFHHACKLGFEGIVSKRVGSPYRSGRSRDWLKMKNPNAPAVKREAEEDWGR
jgi:ATP-dependent DNA ligase